MTARAYSSTVGGRGGCPVWMLAGLVSVLALVFPDAGKPLKAAEEAKAPKQLTCTFPEGTSTTYEAGKFVTKTGSALSFTFGKIDLENQSAELVAGSNSKPLNVRIVRAINANHFLEVVNEGFLNLTTIYDKDSTTGVYPAVHSRHLGWLGSPVFGHYAGTCKDS